MNASWPYLGGTSYYFQGSISNMLWTLQKSCFISCLLKILGKKNRPFEGKHELVLAHCQIATNYGKRMGGKKKTHSFVSLRCCHFSHFLE